MEYGLLRSSSAARAMCCKARVAELSRKYVRPVLNSRNASVSIMIPPQLCLLADENSHGRLATVRLPGLVRFYTASAGALLAGCENGACRLAGGTKRNG